MIDDILPFYEREHAKTAAMVNEFIEEYPQLAGVLGFSGNECSDPSVQRIVSAMIMMGASILKLLEDNYPQFTGSLLGMNYPHFTQPFPSTSIAHFDNSGAAEKVLAGTTVIPRGACLQTTAQDRVPCKFHTVYPVTLAPVRLAGARFVDLPPSRNGMPLAPGATAQIDLVIEGFGATETLAEQGLKTLRIYIDGDPSLRACLRDLLFMQTLAAYVGVDNDGAPWMQLGQIPITPVGFAPTKPSFRSRPPRIRPTVSCWNTSPVLKSSISSTSTWPSCAVTFPRVASD